jgi:hypothetical protein
MEGFDNTRVRSLGAVDPPSSAAPVRTIASQESLDSSPTVPEDTVTLSGLVSPLSKRLEAQVATQNLSSTDSNNKSIASASPAPKGAFSPPSRGSHSSAQESLQQLDQSLQRLGIDPQRISLIRRVEGAQSRLRSPWLSNSIFNLPRARWPKPISKRPDPVPTSVQTNPESQLTRQPKAIREISRPPATTSSISPASSDVPFG